MKLKLIQMIDVVNFTCEHDGKKYKLVHPNHSELLNGEASRTWIIGDIMFRVSHYGYPKAEIFKLVEVDD